ncbi:MAG: sulfatase-like hydrolase/transferase [Pseudomonadota bacterium]
MKHWNALIAVALTVFWGSIAAKTLSQELQQPNVVLILADDMGIETISAYGSTEYKTPNIDALAARGTLFTNALATPICTPSRVMLMTGKYSFRNYSAFGVYPEGDKSIGNLMSEAGYRTALFGKWQLRGALPGDLGFDEYLAHNMIPGAEGDRYWGGRYGNHQGESVNFSGDTNLTVDADAYGPDLLLGQLNNYISKQVTSDQPFFVFYPMMLPHWPFVRTPDSVDTDANSHELFQDMVLYVDKIVGAIVSHIDRAGLADETLIIFTGDNGTYPGLGAMLANGTYWEGAKSAPLLPGQKVPFISAIGTLHQSVSDELIDLADVLPTLADAAGLPTQLVRRDYQPDGRSLLPTILGTGPSPSRDILLTWYPSIDTRPYYSALYVTDGKHKLYHGGAFYDLLTDPFERAPRYPNSGVSGETASRTRLRNALDAWMAESERLKATPPQPRILASWHNAQIPRSGATTLEWDVTEHVQHAAELGATEVTIEAVQYYGLGRVVVSDLAVFENGSLHAAATPTQAVTQLAQASAGAEVSYPYHQNKKDNVFRLALRPASDVRYALRAKFQRESVPIMQGLRSQTNGYLFLIEGTRERKTSGD